MHKYTTVKSANSFVNKKRFGQNFLADKNVLREIISYASISSSDVVLEIGPGQGVLSSAILDAGCSFLHSIEIDEDLTPWLSAIAESNPNRFTLHFADAVKFDYSSLTPFPNKAIANIPYNVTTPLIHNLLPLTENGLRTHIYMVQLEAAQRLMAKEDTKERYPLGVTLEAMGSVKIVRRVPRTCFRPAPNVDSCVIEINISRNFELGKDETWNKFLHAGFRQRRKMLINNLKGYCGIDVNKWCEFMEQVGIDNKIRAEDLSCEQWMNLYKVCSDVL